MEDIMSMGLTNEDEMRGKYLTFRVHDGEYGIEISYISEIVGVQEITPVPNSYHYVKGIINLRGTVVPIIDMRLRFGLPEIDYTDRTCIVVLTMEEMNIGLIVDDVQEVTYIDDESIQPPPKMSMEDIRNFFVKAIGMAGGSVKQFLDVNRVFEVEESAVS